MLQHLGQRRRILGRGDAAITTAFDSIPSFTALTLRSENTASICAVTKSGGTS